MPLPLDTNLNPDAAATDSASERHGDHADDYPVRPPISPINPTASLAHVPSDRTANHGDAAHQPTFIHRPPPVPLSEDGNADAIALRAAISVLQLQKEKSKRDIQALQQLKEAAAQEPEAFTEDLLSGKLKHEQTPGDPLRPTFEQDLSDEEEDGQAGNDGSKFGKIPSAQNVFRCPPVNWSKYHVVGESLDKIHEDQRRRPSGNEPWKSNETPAAEAVIAAPYSPFRDKLPSQQQDAKKPLPKKPT